MATKPLQAVILAAGRGERMRALARSKPLLPVLGMPLLERLVRTVHQCGIHDVVIVTGYEHHAIHSWAMGFREQHPIGPNVVLAHNEHWQEGDNGLSLLAAQDYVSGPFLLLMADHVYDSELIHSLSQAALPSKGAVLATDTRRLRADIDMNDVTRVQLQGNQVTAIDKHLSNYDGLDTGAFLCSPAVLEAMQQAYQQGCTRVSDAMQKLADDGRLRAHPFEHLYWQDVDTPQALASTEQALLDQAAGKPADGLVARWLNRPLSKRFTRRFATAGFTPNQISLVAFALGLLAAGLLALPGWLALAAGGLLVQIASVVDGCDGEVSRLHLASTRYGGWLDALLDRYADAAILAALTWHVMQASQSSSVLWVGMLALSGSFISSYSAHKADEMLPHHTARIGRDTRSLIIMIGALLNQPLLTLWVIAVIMNAVVLHRIMKLSKTHWAKPLRRPSAATIPVDDAATIERAKAALRHQLAQSDVPEDAGHADDTLVWLLTLRPDADAALRLAALAHDIERARPDRLRRQDFPDYDAFKRAHAQQSAEISNQLLKQVGLSADLRERVYHLVLHHETGGSPDSNVLRDADSLSYFSHNLPYYFEREGWDATLERARWGYQRLSAEAQRHYASIRHDKPKLNDILAAASAPIQ